MDTLELKVDIQPKDPWSEIAIAQLADLGFDSFVETGSGFIAYAPANIDLEPILNASVLRTEREIQVTIQQEIIPYQNWNAEWETNFQPVYVEEYASILAPFHTGAQVHGMKVVIQPQMSFGTGHHQTTWMMTKALFELDEMPNKVLDMGAGTGVLAIVAEKLGAKAILAVDIEDWSVENSVENVTRNGCQYITCICGDIDAVKETDFGLIAANINKNVLKVHLPHYSRLLFEGGILLLSGFFKSDVDELVHCAAEYNLQKVEVLVKDEWAAIKLIKTKG